MQTQASNCSVISGCMVAWLAYGIQLFFFLARHSAVESYPPQSINRYSFACWACWQDFYSLRLPGFSSSRFIQLGFFLWNSPIIKRVMCPKKTVNQNVYLWYEQVCTRFDSEGQKTDCCPAAPPGDSKPGSSDLNSDALTSELCPPVDKRVNSCLRSPACHAITSLSLSTARRERKEADPVQGRSS